MGMTTMDHARLLEKINLLRDENNRLKIQNDLLRRVLAENDIPFSEERKETEEVIKDRNVLVNERLSLYKSYFRGRNDVYAKKWVSKDNKRKGYSPVVKKEFRHWDVSLNRYVVRQAQDMYEPLTDKVLIAHLSYKIYSSQVIGLYPLMKDDTCFLVVMDFDDEMWKEDVSAITQIADEYRIHCLVEKSQSGNGAHVWFFFETAVKAEKARKLASSMISAAMEKSKLLTMKSYDRIFPSQDTLSNNGLGNLITLPLQGFARQQTNTLFVDRNFEVYGNQWDALRNTGKLSENTLDDLLGAFGENYDTGIVKNSITNSSHTPAGSLVATDFSQPLIVTVSDQIYIPLESVSAKALNRLKRMASFKNPEYYKAQRMRFSTWDKPRIICCAEKIDDLIALPRGCYGEVVDLLGTLAVTYNINDQRNYGNPISCDFSGTLKESQEEAVRALAQNTTGVLSAPTGFGKTVVGAFLVSLFKVNALIIVHTKTLMNQWATRLRKFLRENGEIPEIGLLGGGKDTLNGYIDIAIINSLSAREELQLTKQYGLVLVDECHHVSAVNYESVVKTVNAARVYGLTATPMRNDGHADIIFMQCGNIAYSLSEKDMHGTRDSFGFIVPKFTNFRCSRENLEIQKVYDNLVHDEGRNKQIVDDIEDMLRQDRNILLLSNRIEHLSALSVLLEERSITALVVSGSLSTKKKKELHMQIEDLENSDKQVPILSTGKYLGEGFDLPKLDTLILASPIAWKGNVIQYVGRINREYKDKKEVQVIDYVDFRVPVLERMYQKRVTTYRKIGYSLLPADKHDRKGGLIYTWKDYWELFVSDCGGVLQDIVFSLPHVSSHKVARHREFLRGLLRKTKIKMIVKAPGLFSDGKQVERAYAELREMGVSLVPTDKEISTFIIIGTRIIWYGSINIFSKVEESDSFMRLEDSAYYNDFLSLITEIEKD